jgi:hypothetical protein
MSEITDEHMRAALATTRAYTVMILRPGPNAGAPDRARLVWEHGRRNFELRQRGLLAIVCPVADGSDVAGVGIFSAAPDEVERLMADDPAVAAGIFTVEVHPCRSFPGDALPA